MQGDPRKAGFTLIEMAIVCAIIGLLCLIGIPAFSRARDKSQTDLCKNNQRIINEQLNVYCLDRNLPCTNVQFPHLCSVRDALVPLGGGAKYVKNRRVFACPSNPDQTVQHDYGFVRDGARIIDIDCDFTPHHNL